MAPDLITVNRAQLEALDDEALGALCAEPSIQAIRGADLARRTRLYGQMTPAQRALLMFWVVYRHGHGGFTQLVAEVPHLAGHAGFWEESRAAARYFALGELAALIAAFEAARGQGTGAAQLDERLERLLPEAVREVAAHIRAHASEFMHVLDG